MQCRRDRKRGQRTIEHVPFPLLAQQTTFQHAFGQFLDEQRHAVGAIDDLLDDLFGQSLAAGDLLCQSRPVVPVQASERHHAHLRLAGPRRLEVRAERQDQQHRQTDDPFDKQVEQFTRGRVYPMRVLEDHDQALPPRQTLQPTHQRL